jgi:aerobic carbon-monoxide dehydrogenase large subunit
LLEVSPADLVFGLASSAFAVAGDPDVSVPLAALAERERLFVRAVFRTRGPTFPFGAHVAVVEVDTETGKVVLRRVVTVDDAGTVVNPLLAEGQRHGGIAQGAAQAFLEEVVFDADGNPLTASFADYPFLSAAEVPSFELADMATPTSYNPLGAKGIGRPAPSAPRRPCRTRSSTRWPPSASGTSTCPPRRSGYGRPCGPPQPRVEHTAFLNHCRRT